MDDTLCANDRMERKTSEVVAYMCVSTTSQTSEVFENNVKIGTLLPITRLHCDIGGFVA